MVYTLKILLLWSPVLQLWEIWALPCMEIWGPKLRLSSFSAIHIICVLWWFSVIGKWNMVGTENHQITWWCHHITFLGHYTIYITDNSSSWRWRGWQNLLSFNMLGRKICLQVKWETKHRSIKRGFVLSNQLVIQFVGRVSYLTVKEGFWQVSNILRFVRTTVCGGLGVFWLFVSIVRAR